VSVEVRTETFIHPTAVVEQGAQIGAGVRIGPFCYVGADAVIADRVELVGHVSVIGATTLGEGCSVFPQAVLGGAPQNVKHKGARTTLAIGRNCTIRESVTMHVGTDTSRGETIVGDNGNFLAYTHIAHDCIVGSNVTFANCATLGGHCEVGDDVIIGGLTAVHQFVRVGHHAFLAGCSAIVGDVIPYGMAAGNRAKLRGFNIIGMRRSGMPRQEITTLRKAYRMIFDRARPMSENIRQVAQEFQHSPAVSDLIAFISDRGKRHYTVPALHDSGDDGADHDI
jgi:UDP-N-acetylglucosamine acyltransferase